MQESRKKRRGLIVAIVALCAVLIIGGAVAAGIAIDYAYARWGGEPMTLEQAQELALEKTGLTDATFTKGKYDRGDGVYELEFYHGRTEYELEVDAYTGWIREAEKDRNTVWDRVFD